MLVLLPPMMPLDQARNSSLFTATSGKTPNISPSLELVPAHYPILWRPIHVHESKSSRECTPTEITETSIFSTKLKCPR
jgi:hypothetical protein